MSNAYDLWLHMCFGPSSAKTQRIFEWFGSSKRVFDAGETEWRLCPGITAKNIDKMFNTTLDEAKKLLEKMSYTGIRAVTFCEMGYPERLRAVEDKPFMLFIKGNADFSLETPHIAMVGTRRPSTYGRECAATLAGEIAEANGIVVSGGADGIDTVSHENALRKFGQTVCVLGCGIDSNAPDVVQKVRNEISKDGALVSEMLPFSSATKYSFVARNRIIAALSDATVVVEAGEKSGALYTAKDAMKYGRKLYAVTGPMYGATFSGSNKLLESGAAAVFSAKQIFTDLGFEYRHRTVINEKKPLVDETKTEKKITFTKPTAPADLSADAKTLFEVFNLEEMTTDELLSSSRLSPKNLLSALSELEIYGIISAVGGKKYRFNNEVK